jgi:hypothetical protein
MFEFATNPQDKLLGIMLSYSCQHVIEEEHLHDVVSPPLSHNSDLAFLEWKRTCTKHNTNPKDLKHVFIGMIRTKVTQSVFEHILLKKGTPMKDQADVPTWDHKLEFLPESADGKALLATVQGKGIFWMLLQHREHLGKKSIKKICLFKDDKTGTSEEYDPSERGPSLYFELEDVQ